jgi:hypothetical protein
MSPEYLAGFFDGEGCIDVQRVACRTKGYEDRMYVRPRVRVSQAVVGVAVLRTLHDRFGGHLCFRRAHQPNQSDSYSLEFLSEDNVRDILNTMLPNLIVKREQAKLVLGWYSQFKGLQTHLDAGIDQVRHIFKEELAVMKRDPQRLSEEALQRMHAAMMR